MTDTIVVALITAAASVLGYYCMHNRTMGIVDLRVKVLEQNFDELKGRLSKQDELAERVALAEQSLKTISSRMGCLEED